MCSSPHTQIHVHYAEQLQYVWQHRRRRHRGLQRPCPVVKRNRQHSLKSLTPPRLRFRWCRQMRPHSNPRMCVAQSGKTKRFANLFCSYNLFKSRGGGSIECRGYCCSHIFQGAVTWYSRCEPETKSLDNGAPPPPSTHGRCNFDFEN